MNMVADQEEIHRLSLSEDVVDRMLAVRLFKQEFVSLPDKLTAWHDLIRLVLDKDFDICHYASKAIGSSFPFVPDKSAAWNDLIRLIYDRNLVVRYEIDCIIGSVFLYIPDKSAAWEGIHKLINDENWVLRRDAVHSLGYAFPYIPDKSAAWEDIHKLINDEKLNVRCQAAFSLGSIFPYIPEEYMFAVWEDLLRLIYEEDLDTRCIAFKDVSSVFPFIPREYMFAVWEDLLRLTGDEDLVIRNRAVFCLGSAFPYIPKEHKSVVWEDLYKLTGDENSEIRSQAVFCLGSAFPYIPEEQMSTVYDYLLRLTSDENSYVKMNANYSLGKISIYKASQSEYEKNARSQLEEAIRYFGIANNEYCLWNPATFCYPFYCSFHAILFKKVNSKKEIEDYLTTAKKEIHGSEIKEKLIETMEQLAGILEMAHNAKDLCIDYQELLTRSSDIFKRVDQLMEENKNTTPAIHGLFRIAKPSFNKTIIKLIDNIREKIEIGRDKAAGTPYQDLFNDAEKEVKYWKTGNDEENLAKIKQIIEVIREKMPPEKVEVMHDKFNKTIVERDIPKLLEVVFNMMQEIVFYSTPSKQGDEVKSMLNDLLMESAKVTEDTTHMRKTIDKTYEKIILVDDRTVSIENKVDSILQNVTELNDLSSKLKEEGNEKESKEVSDIADKIKALFDSGDKKDIAFFIEKLREKVPTLLEEIDKSNAPNNVKEKAKMDLKEKIMKAGKDISLGVATNWIAAYLPSIVGAGASGLLVPGIILAALLSIDNLRDKK